MKDKLTIIKDLVVKDLDLSGSRGLAFSSLGMLSDWLTNEIQLLIDHDFQKLLTILYRIDIHEEKAKAAFTDENPARRLAELIIKRELQKVETRKKYL